MVHHWPKNMVIQSVTICHPTIFYCLFSKVGQRLSLFHCVYTKPSEKCEAENAQVYLPLTWITASGWPTLQYTQPRCFVKTQSRAMTSRTRCEVSRASGPQDQISDPRCSKMCFQRPWVETGWAGWEPDLSLILSFLRSTKTHWRPTVWQAKVLEPPHEQDRRALVHREPDIPFTGKSRRGNGDYSILIGGLNAVHIPEFYRVLSIFEYFYLSVLKIFQVLYLLH